MTDLASPIRIIQTDFRSGEIDPRLIMRVDSKIYPSAATSLKNVLLSSAGAASRRPGTTRLAALSGKRRLIYFEYDGDEKYIFAFGANALEVYDAAGTLVTSYSGSTNCPWGDDAAVKSMTFAQAADVMIICHRSFRPRVLRRTGLSSFTISTFAFSESPGSVQIYQPYYKFENASVTLAISSASSGTGRTVTASSPIFSSAWVGDVIRIYDSEITITGYTSTTVVTGTVKRRIQTKLDPNPFLAFLSSNNTEVTHAFHGLASGSVITIANCPAYSGVGASSINGNRTITSVIDEDRYTFTADGTGNSGYTVAGDFGGSAITIQTTAATRRWDEQVFSSRRGWPAACCFHEDRLWFGGSTSVPDGLWASRTGDYFNFDVAEGEDDASIQVSIGSPRVAQIKHILSNRVLQVFTEGAEFVARQSDGLAMTPSSVSIRSQTPFGSTDVCPRSFDGATVFVQANSKTVREFAYANGEDAFQSAEITTISSHLLNDIQSFDVLYGSTSRTEQYAFFINGDGTMAVFHSNRAEQLASWTPWRTTGTDTFESVCVLETRAFVSVNRGGTRDLERIALDNPAITLDFAISQTSGSPQQTWTLGAAYAGRTLAVLSNGWYLGAFTANGSGVIDIGRTATAITAGLAFDFEVIPVPVDTQLNDGPMTGVPRRVSSVTTHVFQSNCLRLNSRSVVSTTTGSSLATPPASTTGKVRRFLFGYTRDPAVRFTQAMPLPVTILGIVQEVSL